MNGDRNLAGACIDVVACAQVIESLGLFADSLVQNRRPEQALDVLVQVQTHTERLTRLLTEVLSTGDA